MRNETDSALHSQSSTLNSPLIRPGYKQTEIGVIPEDWAVVPFSEFVSFQNGINADKDAYGRGIRFVNVLEVITNSHLYADDIPGRVEISSGTARRYTVEHGDFLFNRTSETQDEVGIGSVYMGKEIIVFGGFVIRGRPRDGRLQTLYAGYGLRAPGIRGQIVTRGQGAIRANIGQADLRQVLVPIPPKAEQVAIAGVLSDADALIESLEQLIAKKRQIKQGAMQELLTGYIRLPGFSGEWELRPLDTLVETITSGIYGFEHHGRGRVQMPVATTAHISDDDLWNGKAMQTRFFSREQVGTYAVKAKDLVVVKSSGSAASIKSGKMALVGETQAGRFVFSNFLMVLRPKEVIPRFLYYYLTSHNVKKLLPSLVEASTYPNIRINEYLALDIPFPEQTEQTAIASILSDMDTEIAALQTKLAKARQIKQGMMQELLTGRIRLV